MILRRQDSCSSVVAKNTLRGQVIETHFSDIWYFRYFLASAAINSKEISSPIHWRDIDRWIYCDVWSGRRPFVDIVRRQWSNTSLREVKQRTYLLYFVFVPVYVVVPNATTGCQPTYWRVLLTNVLSILAWWDSCNSENNRIRHQGIAGKLFLTVFLKSKRIFSTRQL